MTRSAWILAGGLLAGLGVLAVLAGMMLAGTSGQGLLHPDNAKIVLRGKTVYAEACAACHRENLQGEPDWQTPRPDGRMPAPPHDASGHTWHHTSRLLVDMTRLGLAEGAGLPGYQSDMPAFAGILSDADIIAVLSYIKSTWPPDVRNRHDRLDAAGP